MAASEIDTTGGAGQPGAAMGPLRRTFMKLAMKVITWVNLKLLTLSGDRIGYTFLGRNVVLLHTVGHKTGRQYRTPLFYMQDGENVVLVASRAGTSTHPAWLRNLEKSSFVEIQLRSGRQRMRGHIAKGEEREELWPKLIAMFDVWERIQEKSPRLFPVIVLEPESKYA